MFPTGFLKSCLRAAFTSSDFDVVVEAAGKPSDLVVLDIGSSVVVVVFCCSFSSVVFVVTTFSFSSVVFVLAAVVNLRGLVLVVSG